MIAVVRAVSPRMSECELTHFDRTPIDAKLAASQHEEYQKVLESLGCKIVEADATPEYPDSIFVEDTAIVFDELAIITRPGAASRREETITMENTLKSLKPVFKIQEPGLLDGGDVLKVAKKVWIGLSSRSNKEAVEQVKNILAKHNYEVIGVELKDCLHLKSAVTQVEKNTLLINSNLVDRKYFEGFDFIEVHPDEPFAANALLINDTIVFPSAFSKTLQILKDKKIKIIAVDNSEVIKAEGGVTCCSIVFN